MWRPNNTKQKMSFFFMPWVNLYLYKGYFPCNTSSFKTYIVWDKIWYSNLKGFIVKKKKKQVFHLFNLSFWNEHLKLGCKHIFSTICYSMQNSVNTIWKSTLISRFTKVIIHLLQDLSGNLWKTWVHLLSMFVDCPSPIICDTSPSLQLWLSK